MINKVICIVIILLIRFSLISTADSLKFEELNNSIISQSFNGTTLYVGGNGPGNYSKIQDAIDNASSGDTIFVYKESSPYYENIIIKQDNIKLIGEEKQSTIIDGNGIGHVIDINSNNTTLEKFTIQHSGSVEEFEFDSGIHVNYMSNNINITENIIIDNQHGIFFDGCQNSVISKNIILRNIEGIIMYGDARNNVIYQNKIENNRNAIHEAFTRYSHIISNNIANNTGVGIICSVTTYHITEKNNFINNSYHAYFEGKLKYFSERNIWIRNYWDSWIGFGPKIIKGRIYLPWINFDWFPENKPYNISLND